MATPIAASCDVLALSDGPCMDGLTISPCGPSLECDTVIPLPGPIDVIPGVVGLQNIGNTCFMNSVLQCLLHCGSLCEYFLTDDYKDALNFTNPLGAGGKLANEFARLVRAIWKPSERVVVPRDLKHVIGEHAPMFLGYQQQDSQEFVTFLLDGLHEDLNLVLNKPYVLGVEANGRPDVEVAAESWSQHLLRNRSRIVDLFQGQFKSRLCCPQCNKSSVTFDPFMYLSLPIPSQPDLPILVTYTSASQIGLPPVRMGVHVFRDATDLPRTIAAAVAAALPDEYTSDLVTNDICVYQSGGKLMDENCVMHHHNTNRIFCSYSPGISSFSRSPRESPSPKRARNDALYFCLQARIGRKSDWRPTLIGGPSIFTCSASLEDFVSAVKRTIVYLTGGKSREVFEGMRHATVCIGEVRFPLNTSLDNPSLLDAIFDTAKTSPICETVYIDIPIEDANCRKYDWSAEDDEKMSWEDLEHEIGQKIASNYRIEKSWKDISVGVVNVRSGTSTSLNDCFQLFATEEVLGEGDEWYCSHCATHVLARKKIDIWRMPQVLIIHLKRFQCARGFRNKIEAIVDFPIETKLDVRQFVEGEPPGTYTLFGISNHSGSLYSGHYTAFSKVDNQWYNFNDSYVSKADPTPDSSSYLLFYQRDDSM